MQTMPTVMVSVKVHHGGQRFTRRLLFEAPKAAFEDLRYAFKPLIPIAKEAIRKNFDMPRVSHTPSLKYAEWKRNAAAKGTYVQIKKRLGGRSKRAKASGRYPVVYGRHSDYLKLTGVMRWYACGSYPKSSAPGRTQGFPITTLGARSLTLQLNKKDVPYAKFWDDPSRTGTEFMVLHTDDIEEVIDSVMNSVTKRCTDRGWEMTKR